jgi:hypothetical protein
VGEPASVRDAFSSEAKFACVSQAVSDTTHGCISYLPRPQLADAVLKKEVKYVATATLADMGSRACTARLDAFLQNI